MKKVIERPFRDYFNPHLRAMRSISLSLPRHILWSRCINPLSMMVGLIGVCLVVGLFSTVVLSLGVALALFLGFVYLHTRSMAANIYVKRSLPKTSFFEFEEIEVKYTILNASTGKTPPLSLLDHFGPSKEELVSQPVPVLLERESRRSFLYKKKADSGMGIKQVGPISVCFTDAFGFFEFEVMDDKIIDVEVLPKVEELPDLSMRGSAGSQVYGKYNISSQGSSVNFVGIREYVQGDSLKNVAWKLSAKRGELLVKEFEKMVNAEVSIFLNLEASLQIGTRELSTWEMIKDVTLSITSQQLRQYNSVRFFTQSMYLESLKGHQGMHELARRLITLDPVMESLRNNSHETGVLGSVESLVKKYMGLHQPGENVIVITPFLTADSNSIVETMGALKSLGMNVYCILVDTAGFYSRFLNNMEFNVKFSAPALNGLDEVIYRLKVLGVEALVLDPETEIQESFLRAGNAP